jgi:hypothetical protein
MHRFKVMIPLAIAGVFVLGVSAVARAQTTTSLISITQTMTSGIVGIAASQTARLNAYYPSLPAPYATGALCSAKVSFTDSQGTVLNSAPITVKPGQSVSVDFVPIAANFAGGSGRIELRASVSVPLPAPVMPGSPTPMPGIAMPVAFCSLTPTLEIFDTNTLQTQVVVTDFRLSGFPILGGAVLRPSLPAQ